MPVGFAGWNERLVAQLAVLPVEHRAILSALVASGELAADVADEVQLALIEALAHIDRSRALCYFMMPPVAAPRQDLLLQAKALVEVEGTLDPETIALARAALEKDMAFFEADQAGETSSGDASAAARAAAQFLTELLSVSSDTEYPQ